VSTRSRTSKSPKFSEADLCQIAVKYLEEQGWECYKEVCFQGLEGRADIVGVFDKRLLWIIEAKLHLNLDVIAQASEWQGHAHLVSILTPYPKNGDYVKRRFTTKLLRGLGVGQIQASRDETLRIFSEARLDRAAHRLAKGLIEQLRPEHKVYAQAGTNGGYWTPYKETVRQVQEYVKANPGISLGEAIEKLGKLHYASKSSARATLRKRIEWGQFKGIRMERTGRELRLFPQ
jgi:hypothetical protein